MNTQNAVPTSPSFVPDTIEGLSKTNEEENKSVIPPKLRKS